jgi:hypothetical protein
MQNIKVYLQQYRIRNKIVECTQLADQLGTSRPPPRLRNSA